MKHFYVICILLVSFVRVSVAQDAKQSFVDAEYYFMNEDYERALPLYLKVNKADSLNYNVVYRIGQCYHNMPLKIFKAIPYLVKASNHTSAKYKEGSYKEKNSSIEAVYELGYVYQIVQQFDDAIAAFERYKGLVDVNNVYEIDMTERRIESCKRAKEMVHHPRQVEIENIGNKVNTKYSEFNPCVSANDSVMYFTRITNRVKDPNSDDAFYDNYQIMYSLKTANGWDTPKDLSVALKSDGRYSTVSVSPDGKILLLYRDDYEAGDVKSMEFGSLYMSYCSYGKWSPIKKFDSPINSISEETSGCISNDGKTLYFSSDRKGTTGSLDIWKSQKNGEVWSEPENLGTVINTPYDEEFPHLVNDSLLFFCSDGHDNIGGKDIFYSKLTANGWSTPVNLSYPINSPADDESFVPIKGGKEAYYAVERHEGYLTFGKKDIYHIVLDPSQQEDVAGAKPGAAQQAETVAPAASAVESDVPVVGVLKLDDNGILTPKITVAVLDSKDKRVLVQTQPDYETGNFTLSLKPGDYVVEVTSDQYDKTTQNIFVPAEGNTSLRFDFRLVPHQVASGEYIKIKALFFDNNKSELARESLIELERVLSLMKANPSLYIEVVGHSDAKGNSKVNQQLSVKRAQAVVDYLVSKGIDQTRFVSKGMGDQEQIAINKNDDGSDNAEGRKLNRRVEMKVLRSDNKLIITENITVPDNLKYKDRVRYSVLVARVDKTFDEKYFDTCYTRGMPKVQMLQDGNQYSYYTGNFQDKADAMSLLNKIQEMGFEKAEIIDNFSLKKPAAPAAKPTGIYIVQLRAQFKPCDINSSFPGLADVKQHFGSDGYYRYYFGEFKSVQDAKTACEKAKNAGYHDAFVVDFGRYKAFDAKTSTATEYTVQIHASYKRVDPNTFKNVKGVEEKFSKDGLYRYVVGRFSTWSKAQTILEEVKKQGYPAAFISSLNRY